MTIYILLPIITAICWGLAQVLGKISVQSLSVNNFNTIREFVAAIFSIILLLIFSNRNIFSYDNMPYLISASLISIIGTNLTLTFLYKAMKYGSISVVVVSLCSSPIFVFIYSYLFFDERITYRLTIGIILILLAIILISLSKKTDNTDYKNSVIRPVIYATLSGACQSVMIVGNKIILKHLSYYNTYAVASTFAFFVFLFFSRNNIKEIFHPEKIKGVLYAFYSGIIGRVVGVSCLLITLKKIPSVVTAPIVNTSMFFAIFFGAIIIKEKITMRHIISAIIAFVGVFMVIRG